MRKPKAGTPVADRLRARIVVDPKTRCHNWTGYIAPTGYGQIGTGGRGKHARVHRVAYELARGPIPAGLVLDHLCRNRRCCNPDHLEAVTQRENTLRGEGPAGKAARKTHCPRGHPYDAENTGRAGKGGRYCLACKVQRGRERDWATYKRRRREANAPNPLPSLPDGPHVAGGELNFCVHCQRPTPRGWVPCRSYTNTPEDSEP